MYKSVRHRSLKQLFKPFRFWRRIRGDIPSDNRLPAIKDKGSGQKTLPFLDHFLFPFPVLLRSCCPVLILSRLTLPTLQRQFRLYIPFLGIARPQLQFPHSCVCERFIYYQERSTYFLQQNRHTHRGNI